MDGIDTNALYVQSQSIIPSIDTLAQFAVQIHNFSAEYDAEPFNLLARQETAQTNFTAHCSNI